MIFSHVLYQLSYLGVTASADERAYRRGQRSLSSPSEENSSAAGPGVR